MAMKIAVTGGAGFIGSNIVDAYVEAGHDVVIIDSFVSGKQANVNPSARVHTIDITDPAIKDIFEQERFDVINHHAAQMSVRLSVDEPIFDATVNIHGVLNVLEAARTTGVKKVIFASSGGAIYGDQTVFPADEQHAKRPCSPYGVSKLATEKYLGFYLYQYGIEHTVLRYTNVYGPRQNAHGEAGVVAIFIEKLLRDEQPTINGDGTQTRDYVFVEDVVRANVLALGSKAAGIFNVCTSREQSVNALYDYLQLRMGTAMPRAHGPAKGGEQLRSVCSYKKIESELGWKPLTAFEQGLDRTIDWFKANTATSH
jgi:UDP-glucose 4-epimerase